MFNRAEAEALDQRIRRIMVKVNTERPVTVEDVHLTASTWALIEQPKEAAAGATTGADLALLAVVRGQQGAGDASAQTVFDAACQWRDSTRLDGPHTPGPVRRTLARAVDGLRPRWWQRHRILLSLSIGVVGGGGGMSDVMLLGGGYNLWQAHVVAGLSVAAAAGVFAWLMVQFGRAERR